MNNLGKIHTEACIDLHGLSVESAKTTVIDRIKHFHTQRCYKLTIITGRGAHKNRDGTRGKIFKSLPEWLLEPAIATLIKTCQKYSGYYMLTLHPDQRFLEEEYSKHKFIQGLSRLSAQLGLKVEDKSNADSILRKGLEYLFGLAEVEQQDEKRGIELVKQAAKLGSADAQLLLGSWYTTGEYGIKVDSEKAKSWLTKVIDSNTINTADAHYCLARAHMLGIGARYDVTAGIAHLEQAAAKGHVVSLYNLGRIYSSETGNPELLDNKKANTYLLKAAMQGMVEAQVLLAQRCLAGIGMKAPRPDTAFTWFERAADLGDAESMYRLGQAYYYGKANYQQDFSKALDYYLRAAEHKYAPAYVQAALLLLLCENPNNKGVYWLEKAREIGDADAVFIDALLLLLCSTNIQEIATAITLLQFAKKLGSHLETKFNFLYFSYSSNFTLQMSSLSKIAHDGDAEAQAMCAKFLLQSGHVEEANKWYVKLATVGIERELALKLKICEPFGSFLKEAAEIIINFQEDLSDKISNNIDSNNNTNTDNNSANIDNNSSANNERCLSQFESNECKKDADDELNEDEAADLHAIKKERNYCPSFSRQALLAGAVTIAFVTEYVRYNYCSPN